MFNGNLSPLHYKRTKNEEITLVLKRDSVMCSQFATQTVTSIYPRTWPLGSSSLTLVELHGSGAVTTSLQVDESPDSNCTNTPPHSGICPTKIHSHTQTYMPEYPPSWPDLYLNPSWLHRHRHRHKPHQLEKEVSYCHSNGTVPKSRM